jgi:hypothetical protein
MLKMAVAKPKLPVPKFSASEIKRANACAVLIWNGISYEDGSKIVSDRDLLVYFANEFSQIEVSNSQQFSLSRNILHDLIIVSQLKPMYRKQNELSYAQLDAYLKNEYHKFVLGIKGKQAGGVKLAHASQLVKEAGKAVVKPFVSAKAGYRIPFASRLLFFAAPKFLIFNYANRLAEKKMNYQSRPHYAYQDYAFDMLEGLRLNWGELSKYCIPTENADKIERDVKLAYNTHWWARRVFDIALLIRFGVFKPLSNPYGIVKNLQYIRQKQTTVGIP